MIHPSRGAGIVILAAILVAASSCPAEETPPGALATAWPRARWQLIGPLTVTISEPHIIARDHARLWFPTISRMGDKLMILMSTEPDIVGERPDKVITWSKDNGLTWSTPVAQPLLRGGGAVELPGHHHLILPFALTLQKDGIATSPYPLILPDTEEVRLGEGELTVRGWPRPPEHLHEGDVADFRFNRQAIPFPGGSTPLTAGGYVGTMYGRFKGDKRVSLICVHSVDGLHWTARGIIADGACRLEGREGPNEAAICRLKDGRLMSIYRLDSGAPYGQSFSSDDGKTWTDPAAMNDVFSVCPYLLVNPNGVVVLSGGRPGLYLWINIDGTGKDWQKIDLQDVHNTCELSEAIGGPHTTAYTQMQWIDATHLLYVYDRVPFGWGTIPPTSRETNSIWVMRIEIKPTAAGQR